MRPRRWRSALQRRAAPAAGCGAFDRAPVADPHDAERAARTDPLTNSPTSSAGRREDEVETALDQRRARLRLPPQDVIPSIFIVLSKRVLTCTMGLLRRPCHAPCRMTSR